MLFALGLSTQDVLTLAVFLLGDLPACEAFRENGLTGVEPVAPPSPPLHEVDRSEDEHEPQDGDQEVPPTVRVVVHRHQFCCCHHVTAPFADRTIRSVPITLTK